MKVLVCAKLVPDTSDATITLGKDGKSISMSGLNMDINEADNYAVEEALRIVEKNGGEVVVVSISGKDSETMMRMALAKGCERGIRVEAPEMNSKDPMQVAAVLAAACKQEGFDMVVTGCMSSDNKNMCTGVALAEMLGINHASMVKGEETSENTVRVQRELEGGLLEVDDVALPALLAVQTGINEPRYAPIIKLRQAMKKELKVLSLADLSVAANEVSEEGSKVQMLNMYFPVVESNCEYFEGSPDEEAEQAAMKLLKGGLM